MISKRQHGAEHPTQGLSSAVSKKFLPLSCTRLWPGTNVFVLIPLISFRFIRVWAVQRIDSLAGVDESRLDSPFSEPGILPRLLVELLEQSFCGLFIAQNP